jgi:FMN phosphatase YigB (HAD superfamily)
VNLLCFCYPVDMRYDVVFLDWHGTLCTSIFWEHWAQDSSLIAANLLIQRHLFETSTELVHGWMLGDWNAEAITEEISRRTQIDAGELLAGLRESCESMKLLDDALFEAVGNLRRNGTKVVIATDNMDTFTRWTVPSLKLSRHFDAILNSHDLRAFKRHKTEKGDSKFFSRYLSDHGINPARTILIDDSQNAVVVKDFGMNYAQVTTQASALSILSDL